MVTGIIGALLILGAWFIEARKIIKSKNVADVDERFLLIYVAGSILLTVYAVEKQDIVFTALGAAISLLTLVEMVIVHIRKH
jgi:lipid-A-disaccharide synthase-like uncharacterized protein